MIIRTDAAIQSDWAERGALDGRVVVNGFLVASLGTANLTQGTSTLTYNFVGPRPVPQPSGPPQRPVLTASGTLVNSNAVHTALVTTVL